MSNDFFDTLLRGFFELADATRNFCIVALNIFPYQLVVLVTPRRVLSQELDLLRGRIDFRSVLLYVGCVLLCGLERIPRPFRRANAKPDANDGLDHHKSDTEVAVQPVELFSGRRRRGAERGKD